MDMQATWDFVMTISQIKVIILFIHYLSFIHDVLAIGVFSVQVQGHTCILFVLVPIAVLQKFIYCLGLRFLFSLYCTCKQNPLFVVFPKYNAPGHRGWHAEGGGRAFSHCFFLASRHEEEERTFSPVAHCYPWMPRRGPGQISTRARWCGAGVLAIRLPRDDLSSPWRWSKPKPARHHCAFFPVRGEHHLRVVFLRMELPLTLLLLAQCSQSLARVATGHHAPHRC
jgi:hypothetical protein